MTRDFFLLAGPKQTSLVVLYGTSAVRERIMAMASKLKHRQEDGDETEVRERILDAAFTAFMKSGYAAASMLEIATRASVSKRELYALVGNKQEMLIWVRHIQEKLDRKGKIQIQLVLIPSTSFVNYIYQRHSLKYLLFNGPS